MTMPSRPRLVRFLAPWIAITMATAWSGASAQTAADEGKAVFEQCAACHTVDGSDAAGPTLQGLAGRKAGTVAGVRYSRALRNSGITWDAASLDAFIADPQTAVPGTAMPYSGLTDARQRTALIAYLLALPSTTRP